ncbi:carbohydrate esterase family 3 protein [Zasmidium cellare ATCC 36951]|uniref:Carbohydrate esterase family 3 protein n=1 Tax=Zasmidium cellare ATCC 36951 TaxID=1080233 RepID=A0A6A6C250_ZASCE|nr:carbohydrate esterase family 3 protein [Zasmidium cellare ATCC 36951]KAF2161055.1 carbohydrate esterase family 3 protein [Zasmidium cellare ATCC 36951]
MLRMVTRCGFLASLLAVTAWARQSQVPESDVTSKLHRRAPFPVPLKVCCVGDSITSGIGSTGDNEGDAWRRYLYDLITQGGTSSTFVGKQTGQYSAPGGGVASVSSPNFPQPDNEAAGGYRINQIIGLLQQDGTIAAEQPNLVVIHAGTNDNVLQFVYQDEAQPNTQNCVDFTCIGNAHASETWADAPNRLGNLIDYVLCNNPNAVVLVSVLIQNYINATQGNLFKAAVPEVVASRYEKGFKVRLVDLSSIYPSDDNELHPTNPGYQDMANRIYAAMLDIPSSWWTASNTKAKRADSGPVETCDRNSISFTAAVGGANVAAGWHVSGDPGAGPSTPATSGQASSKQWVPQWGNDGDIAIGTGYPGSGVRLADLDGDGLADYIWVNTRDASFRAWLNGGKDAWFAIDNANEILWGTGEPDYVEFVDLTGDKRAEYVLVQNGAFRVFVNGGKDGDSWSFKESTLAGQQLTNAFGSGGLGLHYFGDLNGDKLADLAILRSSGVVDFYIQQGTIGTDSFSWSPCLNHAELTGSMNLVDIDGDGRADYVSMADNGSLSGWLNTPGGSCDITRVPISGRGADSLAFTYGVPASQVRLADLTGDGKADYVTVTDDTGQLNLYPNNGYFSTQDSGARTGGIGGYGAAVRLADINADGKDDYLSVDDVTGVLAYLNEGQQGNSWSFAEQNNGAVIALGYSGASRSEIQFVDLDANGYADFVMINASTGALHTYLNFGPTDKGYNFEIIPAEIAIGVGGIGAGVRLADMTGSGRADYIYLDESGAARIWVNNGNGSDFADLSAWVVLNNGYDAAIGVGAQRQDVHFHDVDGDGLADYIWVHPDDGSVSVWYNDGPLNSALGWISGGTIQPAMGVAGQNIRFARIGDSAVKLGREEQADNAAQSRRSQLSLGQKHRTMLRPILDASQLRAQPATHLDAADRVLVRAVAHAQARDAQVAKAETAMLPQGPTLGSAPTNASHAKASIAPWPVVLQSAAVPSAQRADCSTDKYSCNGDDCRVCYGSDCKQCNGSDCETCTGSSCNGCNGSDCTMCTGSGCTSACQGGNCPGATAPTTGSSPTTVTAAPTVWDNGGSAFKDHPATAAPSTGCAVTSRQSTTITEAFPQTTEYNTIPAGPYCACAGDVVAGVDSSTDRAGTVFLYCATGITTFASTNAQATATATASPGSADNPDWAHVSCSYGSLTDRYNNRTQMWDDAGASAAWDAVVLAWKESNQAMYPSFADFVTDWFDAGDQGCTILGFGGCASYMGCSDSTSPAAWLIVNSIATVFNILNSLFGDVRTLDGALAVDLGAFTDKFSIDEKYIEDTMQQQQALRKKYNTALLVLSIIINFTFATALKTIGNLGKGLQSNLLSSTGSTLYGEISNAFSFHELSLETENILYTQNTVDLYGGFVVSEWTDTIQNVTTGLFNNPDSLGALMNYGAYFTSSNESLSANDQTNAMTAALFANLLPVVWQGSPALGEPLIITAGTSACDRYLFEGFASTDGIFHGVSDEGTGRNLKWIIDSADLAMDTCFTHNGVAFYLLWLYVAFEDNYIVHFGIPPGPPSQLNGTAGYFGGLDIDQVTANAVNSWQANNQTNDFSNLVPTSILQDVFAIGTADIANAPGLVQLPICQLNDVAGQLYASSHNDQNSTSWPCQTGLSGKGMISFNTR